MSTEIMEILSELGEDLARDIVAHRRGLKCPLTPRGARSLLKQYKLTGNAVEAAEEHLNRGWVGFKFEWMTKPTKFQDQRNPYQAKPSPNYGNPEPIQRPPELNDEERQRRADIAARARDAIRSSVHH